MILNFKWVVIAKTITALSVDIEKNTACGHQLVKHVVNSKIWGFMWSDLRGSLA